VEAFTRGLDVLLNPGFTAPLAAPCPLVTVFHDLQHLRHPEFFRWFDLPFWRVLLRAAAHRSQVLIAISEATRDDLLGYYCLPASRVVTVPLGVDAEFFDLASRPGPEAAEPYLLCVSTLHPHKNLERLIRVFAALRQSQPGLRLVLAGPRGFHAARIEAAVLAHGLQTDVTITGWISRDDLLALYRDARAFVYPSLFEGFGIPVLEALAAGLPTACSDIEPLRSLAGDAAVRFDPARDEAMLEALRRVCADEPLRERLRDAGPRRAREFSWRKTAMGTIEALRRAARR
jgi:glycosyltransferase involved in cell wall biosynthesis